MPDVYDRLLMWLALVSLAILTWHNARKVRKLMGTLDEALAEVASQTTKIASWDALWDAVRQRLADALSGVTLPAQVQAKVDQLLSELRANSLKIDESLAENVPTGDNP